MEQPILLPDPAMVQTTDIPNMYDIAQVFANRKKGKGCGEGLLVSDLFKRFPKIMSQVYYPIMFKSYARLHPPLQWRGGMIQEIFKGKGDPGIPSQYRDVLLADDDSKAMFSVIRKAVFPLAGSFVNSTQYGSGFSGGGGVCHCTFGRSAFY